MKPKLWWVSWWSASARKETCSLSNFVLGWWNTGSRSMDNKYSICAEIEAEDEASARHIVEQSWHDDIPLEYRFCEEKEVYEENSRFPELPWMTERLNPWRADKRPKCAQLLEGLLEWIDHGLPSPPNHTCGPQSPCDCECEHWANFSAFMDECRKEVKCGGRGQGGAR